ncbi:MAG TPA: 4Fe-4S dicluster domain-containing protein [Terriglobia bacterium]|nr:4Fe-4S dicluster domain-containing protein [Terriglobia bacterium]
MAESLLVQPDTRFIEGLMASGAHDLKKCFQCATCSAVCTLSDGGFAFPRKQMLEAQWGMKDKLLEDPGPWLCFYCGECSKNCPRQANPGETMMALRRYLTAEYDWTGLSRRMYHSAFWEIGILALISAVVVALFTLPRNFGFGLLSQSGPEPLSSVMLSKFAPVGMVDLGDRILFLVLSFFLLTNAARMFYHLTRGRKIPARLYLTCLPHLIFQAVTQKRWKECKDSEATKNWIRHLLLVTGYVTMFTMVVVFLPWFQVNDSSIHWTSFLGYYATAVLLGATAWMLLDRKGKRGEMYQFSHLSDWLFPILLFLTAVTGIAMHVLRVNDLAMATYVMYTVHMAIAVPMLAVEVPFGKWAHLLYRPLALYVAAVRREAVEYAGPEPAPAARAVT